MLAWLHPGHHRGFVAALALGAFMAAWPAVLPIAAGALMLQISAAAAKDGDGGGWRK